MPTEHRERIDASLIEALEAVLPQTQCRQCGYDGCTPYATAIAGETADINRCPPGGDAGIARLAIVTRRPPSPLDLTRGVSKPFALARIDESLCIGCTLCIQACPVDAIVGAGKRMHAVVADLCTGCELCLPPCPVDCIDMVAASHAWDDARARAARRRHDDRSARLARVAKRSATSSVAPAADAAPTTHADDATRRRRVVEAAIERAAAMRRQRPATSKTPAGDGR